MRKNGQDSKEARVYAEFGAYMEHIVRANQPVNSRRTTRQYLADKLNVHISLISSWFQGKVTGKHPLTEAAFEQFLQEFFGKPGLEDYGTLRAWVAKGPERLQKVAEQPHWRFMADLRPPTHYVAREKILSEMRRMFRIATRDGLQVLGLQGHPGTGKTTIMKAWALWGKEEGEFNGVFEIADQDDKSTDWLRPLWRSRRFSDTSQGRLFLFDDVRRFAHLQALLEHLQPKDFVVFTTRLEKVAQNIPPKFLIRVGSLGKKEALDLARQMCPAWREDDAEHLHILWELVEGNILGLRLGISEAARRGWVDMLRELRNLPEPHDGEGVFLERLLQMNYHTLGMEGALYQEAFARLGGIPHFHAYSTATLAAVWGVSFEEALRWAHRIAGVTQLMAQSGLDEWQIHDLPYQYARRLFGKLPHATQAEVKKWVQRQRRTETFEAQRRALAQARVNLRFPSIAARLSQKGLPRRVWERARHNKNTEWALLEQFPGLFTSDEFVLGYDIEQRFLNRTFPFWGMMGAVLIALGLRGGSWVKMLLGAGILVFLGVESLFAEKKWQALLGRLEKEIPPGS